MKNKDVRKRRSSKPYRALVGRWLTKLAAHFRVELTVEQSDIFLDRLPSYTDYQIGTAFERCLASCLFFPHLKEVLDNIPEDAAFRGPVRTCKNCEPDGWRIVSTSPPYRAAIRCNHAPDNPPPARADELAAVYLTPPEWAKPGALRKPSTPPRYPHLIGKGIIYDPD